MAQPARQTRLHAGLRYERVAETLETIHRLLEVRNVVGRVVEEGCNSVADYECPLRIRDDVGGKPRRELEERLWLKAPQRKGNVPVDVELEGAALLALSR